jgi:hypothetical protein
MGFSNSTLEICPKEIKVGGFYLWHCRKRKQEERKSKSRNLSIHSCSYGKCSLIFHNSQNVEATQITMNR